MRLAKYLAASGIASRRASEEIVRARRVTVGGEVVDDPAYDVTPEDRVTVDGDPVEPAAELVVYVVNKPAGVVSTARDTHGRPTVVSSGSRLFPVGRLDADTTGLILLTNDGQLAHRLTHPSFQVPKTYRAVVNGGPVRGQALRALREGVMLEDGVTAPAQVRPTGPNGVELTIHEGRKRQVRRMCEAVGHPVVELKRVSFGPLQLGGLRVGEYRRLTAREVEALAAAGGAAGAAPSGGGRRQHTLPTWDES
jgi:23S rRNA pseudouridine2605 synthase